MTLNQISVFVENKPGKLQVLTDVLAKNNINMRAVSLAETSEFGIVRIIVDDLLNTASGLRVDGFVYTSAKVLGVAIPDEPGGLNRVLHMLSEENINIEYMYAFLGGKDTEHAYMIFRVQEAEAAVKALMAKGVKCIMQEDLSNI
ncbi:MAG: acetolactate synthase [Clostridia bacterium]|nr:acetolactate synthase [Clostridia bacterium]